MAKIIIEYEAHEFLDHETQHVFYDIPFQTANAIETLIKSCLKEYDKCAINDAYHEGYVDCLMTQAGLQKLHAEELKLKDKLNKLDVEDAWERGYEAGIKTRAESEDR